MREWRADTISALPAMTACAMRKSILRPEHFRGLTARLIGSQLCYRTTVGKEEREAACLQLADTFGGSEEMLDAFALRKGTQIVANPRDPGARQLKQLLHVEQGRAMPSEQIDVAHGLRDKFDRSWAFELIEGDLSIEGQAVVLVAFHERVPVGYFSLGVHLQHFLDERATDVHLRGELVYVLPTRRGQGFGVDLCVGACDLARDVLVATYAAVPANWTIGATVSADYMSKGGEAIAQELSSNLEYGMEMLALYGRRRSISLSGVTLDAGW